MARIQISSVVQFESEWSRDFRPEFSSSAKELENLLLRNDIVPPFEIFHEYNLPGNATPMKFEIELKKLWGHLIFDTDRVKYEIDNVTLKALKQQKAKYLVLLQTYIFDIRTMNSKLSGIEPKTPAQLLALLDGATYGYGPDEIELYIKQLEDPKTPMPNSTELELLLGKSVGYELTQPHIDALVHAIKQRQENNKAAIYIQWQKERGMLDD